MPAAIVPPPAGVPSTLRRNYLSSFDNVAQTLGMLAPTGTLGVVIPLLIGKAGNGTWLLFLVILAIFLLILVNLNAFATRTASAGGLATFAELALGPRAGLVTGWIYVGATLFGVASSAPSAAYYAGLVIAQTTGIANTPLLQAALSTAVVALAWWTARRDMKLSSDVMIVTELTSLAVIVAILVIAQFRQGVWVDRAQLGLRGVTPAALSSGLVLAFLTLGGFESATTLGDESRQAERTIPRAILGCLLPIGFLYLFLTYLLVGLGRRFGLALDQLEAPFDTIARANHLAVLGTGSSLGIALSYLGCTLGSINAGSRTLYALAERGKFFAAFGRAHPRNGTPHRAIALFGAVSIAVPALLLAARVPLVSVIDYLSQLAALGFIGSYFMVCLGAPLFLRARGSLGPGALAASAGALVLLAVVMVQSVTAVSTAPACYLPYVFAATVGLGCALSAGVSRRPAAVPA